MLSQRNQKSLMIIEYAKSLKIVITVAVLSESRLIKTNIVYRNIARHINKIKRDKRWDKNEGKSIILKDISFTEGEKSFFAQRQSKSCFKAKPKYDTLPDSNFNSIIMWFLFNFKYS